MTDSENRGQLNALYEELNEQNRVAPDIHMLRILDVALWTFTKQDKLNLARTGGGLLRGNS